MLHPLIGPTVLLLQIWCVKNYSVSLPLHFRAPIQFLEWIRKSNGATTRTVGKSLKPQQFCLLETQFALKRKRKSNKG